MDLEKNIEIAFGVYWKNLPVTTELNTGTHLEAFITGAKSQAAKDFWYNEFKQTISVGILNQINDLPTHKVPEQCPDVKYLMDGSWNKYKEYIYYNPDRPISFNNWKYMIENYKGESSNIIHKHIGVIGHVDHGKTSTVGLGLCESQKGLIIMDMDTPLTPEERFEVMKNLKPDLSTIKSIVPIADVIPEEIISKQEFLKMHDKAVERSITEETYKESRAWDIKKEKKVSHKRNNKRK